MNSGTKPPQLPRSPSSVLRGLRDRSSSIVWGAWLRALGVEVGDAVRLIGRPIVSRRRDSSVSIGPRSVLISRASRTALGVSHRVILRTLRVGATIEIGSDVGISGAAICAAERITIGDRVLLGADVIIADTDFHALDAIPRRYAREPEPGERIIIKDDVFVGARSIVLKGAVIGEGSVIGAESVVTGEIPASVVAAGTPCRVIRSLSNQESPA